MSENYDLVILGAGVGGYVAALRAAELGMKVALVEKEKVGGVCLHKGCIPSKTLLKSAELYDEMKKSEQFGIRMSKLELNFSMVQGRKQKVVEQLYQGLQYLIKQRQIDLYQGTGRIMGPSIFSPLPGTISVEFEDERDNQILIPQFVLIATGSSPRALPGWEVDGDRVCFSDHALLMEDLPQSVVIVGGGVIGIEWASLLNDFDVKVTIVEAEDRILPFEDEEISFAMKRSLEQRNITIYTGVKITPDWIRDQDGKVMLPIQGDSIPADKVILSVGRQANTRDLGLQNTTIQVDQGWIDVNPYMQTAESHIYAIGDVIGGYQLAHVASREGIIAVEHMAGMNPDPLDPMMVPRCIYSRPEVSSIGLTETEAKQQGYDVKIGKVSLQTLGKPMISGTSEGFIKMISDRKTDDLLGVHIIGTQATELIGIASVSKTVDATAWEIGQSVFPHPTVSEILGEVGLSVDGSAIHSVSKKKVAE